MNESQSEAVPIIEDLGGDKWVQLKRIVSPAHGVNGYTYSHEVRCDGEIISILPFRYDSHEGRYLYLLRHEWTPCWSLTEHFISSITGGREPSGAYPTAVSELMEEAGYDITVDDLIDLDLCKGIKSCDTDYHLFSCDLTKDHEERFGKDPVPEKIVGNTTDEGEMRSWNEWHTDLSGAMDPFLYASFYRLQRHLLPAAP